MRKTSFTITINPETLFEIEKFALKMDFSVSKAVEELCKGALYFNPEEVKDMKEEELSTEIKALKAKLAQAEQKKSKIDAKKAKEEEGIMYAMNERHAKILKAHGHKKVVIDQEKASRPPPP
jgi:hypothetical protein